MKSGVLALDYDGTIAIDGVLNPGVRTAIAEVRHGVRGRLDVRARRRDADGRRPGGGLVGALAAGRMVSTLLFGVTARDPATLAAVLCVVAGAAACATCLPARRAAGVDPNEILKAE